MGKGDTRLKHTESEVLKLQEELERLRSENARLSAFFGYASDAFIVLNSNRKIIEMNEAAMELTGYINGQGMHCGDLFKCHDEQGRALRDELCFGSCTLNDEKSLPYTEMILRHPAGHSYHVSVSYSYIPVANGDVFLLMVMRDLTTKKRLEQELMVKNELEITLKERERLSRDLHDGLVQSLAFLGLKSKMALSQLDSEQVTRARNSVEEITSVVQESYSEVRQALYDLRTPATEDLAGYLGDYLQNFTLQTKIENSMEVADDFPKCHNQRTSIHVLKVVQEAIANVRKHAKATHVTLRLLTCDHEVLIMIDDNGQGFEVGKPTNDGIVHYGLTTMGERMHLIGGRIEVQSEPGQGTKISLYLNQQLFQ